MSESEKMSQIDAFLCIEVGNFTFLDVFLLLPTFSLKSEKSDILYTFTHFSPSILALFY